MCALLELSTVEGKELTPAAAGYLGSMIGTLWAALHMHSYVLSIIFCVAQVRSCLRLTAACRQVLTCHLTCR